MTASEFGLAFSAISEDGRYLALTCGAMSEKGRNGIFYTDVFEGWESSSRRSVLRIQHQFLSPGAFGRDSRYLALSGLSSGSIWDISTRTEVARVEYDDDFGDRSPTRAFLNPNDNFIVTTRGKGARVWELDHSSDVSNTICQHLHDQWRTEWKAFFPDQPLTKMCSDFGNH